MDIKIEIKCSCGSKSMMQIFPDKKEYICNSCGSELFKAHITTGYVYILSNPSMPNLLKIGFTERNVDERVEELNSTGVPVPFEIEAIFGSPNAYVDEQTIHGILNQHRLANNREFFSIGVKEAVQCVIDYIGSEPNFLKSPNLLMTEEEKQTREEFIRENQDQRRLELKSHAIARKKHLAKLYIEQLRLSDLKLARERQLKYEAEFNEPLDLEPPDEHSSINE